MSKPETLTPSQIRNQWKHQLRASKVSSYSKLVAYTIESRLDHKTLECTIDYNTLMSDCGLSRNTVYSALKMLLDAGLLTKRRRYNRSNVYSIQPQNSNLYTPPDGAYKQISNLYTPPDGAYKDDNELHTPPEGCLYAPPDGTLTLTATLTTNINLNPYLTNDYKEVFKRRQSSDHDKRSDSKLQDQKKLADAIRNDEQNSRLTAAEVDGLIYKQLEHGF